MKKIYEEPMIVVEQYALTQNIAACAIVVPSNGADCVINSTLPNDYKNMAYGGFFNAGAQGCAESASGTSDEDGTCYNQSANGAFTS